METKYDYCAECQEAELELLHELHMRHLDYEIKKLIEEENQQLIDTEPKERE